MIRHSRWCGLVLVGLLLNTAGCIVYPVRVEVQDHKSATLDGMTRVAVETRNGAIEVRCDPTARQVEVNTTRSARGMTEKDAREFAEKIEIEVGKDPSRPDTLRIAARMPVVEANRNQGAKFEIVMPPSVELALDTRNGRIDAAGCDKDIHANTSNGRVNIRDCDGSVFAETSNGEISAWDIKGDVDIRTSNGHIDLQRVGKNTVKAVTSNGRIKIVDATGAANLRTSNGSIALHCKSVPPSPDIQVVTSNGHVEVEVPSNINASVDLQTTNGRVHSDLKGVQVADLETHRSSLRAKLNDGGGRINASSSNGSVTLRTVSDTAPTTPPTTVKPTNARS
ncbi:MAG: DUF4097 family beta strand repeat protein [Planctomycetes bacterium]|nr:DUF4097 family beta strand repeat protein [Planctomycetota bacterium]